MDIREELPSAEVVVMGAEGKVSIVGRRLERQGGTPPQLVEVLSLPSPRQMKFHPHKQSWKQRITGLLGINQ